ncbi:hypothetical protein OSSY52_06980 [Tepiditoga spiralis]|uniref:Tetratricopeptide repeat protein n=1 Tax=Tepiditoga spiralis TaxID=2108365 RepID=A0A7G1G6N3_9BACT|nr:tetratricopeptide repeat protein [Tepiditoga spiralis]BBE30557.1 hypothetical protein OSSY52_06980 [Tepiditoga spiralis]
MKKIFISLFFIILVSLNFTQDYQKLFLHANSIRSVEEMNSLIRILNTATKTSENLSILCQSLTELANWGIKDESERIKTYEKAIEYGKKAVKLNPKSYYANYVTGTAIGRLAQFKGIIESLFMLGDFDKYLKKALELNPNYSYTYIALGMRYRDVPWPLNNMNKSEEYLKKALELNPKYSNIHYELGILYEKINKKDLAKKEFEKVLTMDFHPDWIAQGKETIELVKLELKKLNEN